MSKQRTSEQSGCPDCGHALMEHGAFGCTHGYREPPRDDLARGYEVCSCRRGRHDPLPEAMFVRRALEPEDDREVAGAPRSRVAPASPRPRAFVSRPKGGK